MLKKSLIRVVFVFLFVGITAVPIINSVRASKPSQETFPSRIDPNNFEMLPRAKQENLPTPSSDAINSATETYLSWSKVVFQSFRNNNWEIYFGNDDGSDQRRLTYHGASDIHPSLNRGTTRIAFASYRDGDYEIYTMDTNGAMLNKLTSNDSNDGNPIWSPDGSKIAFQSYRDGQAEIYVMNANGSSQKRLTNHSDYDGSPTWSPDGTKIAFVSRRTGGYRIYTMNSDGSGITQISDQPYSANPTWSPDGEKIAFDADVDGDGWKELWLMNQDGSDSQILYDPYGQKDAWARSWSPDSRYVAFTEISFTEYRGNWYWTYAYLKAQDTQPNYMDPSQLQLSSSSLDWNPNWQTQDNTAPNLHLDSLDSYTKLDELRVSWSGQDDLSGIDYFEIQYRTDKDAPWQDWEKTTETHLMFDNAMAGTTYEFRARAVDLADNTTGWKKSATTLFSRKITGQITDNRGNPISSATINTSPVEVTNHTEAENGSFQFWLKDFYTHTLNINAASYGNLPPTSHWITDDIALEFVLPPADNIVDNSSFENILSTSNWQVDGIQLPVQTSKISHTGQKSIEFGSALSQTNFLDGNICVRPQGDTNEPHCQFTSIQAAVNASYPNQTIWVFPGIYTETISINTYNVSLKSVVGPYLTIIDGDAKDSVIRINASNVLVEGFTIQNGKPSKYYRGGGGATANSSGTTIIRNNRFINNRTTFDGGGIYTKDGNAQIIGNWFINNYSIGTSSFEAACIYSYHGTPLIANNVFLNNNETWSGACIGMHYTTHAQIYNNTFVGNYGGIDPYQHADVRNNIVVDSLNAGLGYYTYSASYHCPTTVYFNNVWQNKYDYPPNCLNQTNRHGNMSTAPQLLSDFQLAPTSPLINAGDPNPSFNDLDGSRNDMGAFGGPYALQENSPSSPWSHQWLDLSPWSGEVITVSFQLKNNDSGQIRSQLSQSVTVSTSLLNPTLSFLSWTGAETTSGNESFVVSIENSLGQTTEFVIDTNTNNQLWAYLDEVSIGSSYPDLRVSIAGEPNTPPGEQTSFTINYENRGGVESVGGTITAVLPNSITYVDSNLPPQTTSPLTWHVGDLPAFSNMHSIILTGTVSSLATPLSSISTQVEITAASPELETTNNQSSYELFVGHHLYLPALLKR